MNSNSQPTLIAVWMICPVDEFSNGPAGICVGRPQIVTEVVHDISARANELNQRADIKCVVCLLHCSYDPTLISPAHMAAFIDEQASSGQLSTVSQCESFVCDTVRTLMSYEMTKKRCYSRLHNSISNRLHKQPKRLRPLRILTDDEDEADDEMMSKSSKTYSDPSDSTYYPSRTGTIASSTDEDINTDEDNLNTDEETDDLTYYTSGSSEYDSEL
jgi:hypothetical protein